MSVCGPRPTLEAARGRALGGMRSVIGRARTWLGKSRRVGTPIRDKRGFENRKDDGPIVSSIHVQPM